MGKMKYSIDLELYPEDFRHVAEIAGREGLTTAELSQAFIADLTGSRESNGSDEREHARQWLDRCGFSRIYDRGGSFLTWLIDWEGYRDYTTYRNIVKLYEKVEPSTEEDWEDLQEAREGLDTIYNDYCEHCGAIRNSRTPEDRAEAFTMADKWTSEFYDLQDEAETIEE